MEPSVESQIIHGILEDLRRHGSDHADVEVKRAQKGLPQDMWETLSVFANTAGGLVVLGVDEKAGFAVTGVEDPAQAEHQLATLCGEMEPPIRAEIFTTVVEDGLIVAVQIPPIPRDQRPCSRRSLGPYIGSPSSITCAGSGMKARSS